MTVVGKYAAGRPFSLEVRDFLAFHRNGHVSYLPYFQAGWNVWAEEHDRPFPIRSRTSSWCLIKNGKSERRFIFPAVGDRLSMDGELDSKEK